MLSHDRFVASMLLDGADQQPYLAEVLVRSLLRIGEIAAGNVVLYVAPGVPEAAIEPLRRLGCEVDPVVAEHGAVAGNDLLRQLDAWNERFDAGVAGTWLFSLGTAMSAPLVPPAEPVVAGKKPERELLPLPVVEQIFSAARVRFPAVTRCDADRGTTVATHLDGGLIYVPRERSGALADEWRRCANAIASRPELAAVPERDRTVRDLSLALALAALDAPIAYLGANESFPLDAGVLPPSFDPSQPVRALRCGARIDEFGLVSARVRDASVDAAVASLNEVLVEPSDTSSFARYKRAAARRTRPPELPSDHPFVTALAETAAAFGGRLRVVLHAGTPKTGTKALQLALYRERARLAELGVWYPPINVDPETKKHQYFIPLLEHGDGPGLAGALDDVVRSAPPQTRTIILSTEGFFNHWWDFPPSAKAMLRHLSSVADVEMWVCFREPVAFAIAQYAQLLRNPRVFSPAYGLDIGFDEMLENEWFVKRLDYYGFVLEVEDLIGAGNVRSFRYGRDIVDRIFRALGAGPPDDAHDTVNPSLRQPGVDMMRIVNRYDLPPDRKTLAAALVLQLDSLVGERAEPLRVSPEAERRVRALAGRSWRELDALLDAAEMR